MNAMRQNDQRAKGGHKGPHNQVNHQVKLDRFTQSHPTNLRSQVASETKTASTTNDESAMEYYLTTKTTTTKSIKELSTQVLCSG